MSSQEQLVGLLGFDPLKETITKDVLQEAMKELQEEKTKNAKVKSKELLSKAVELHDQMTRAKREFDGKQKKFEKELGKLVRRISAYANGQEPPQDNDDGQNQNNQQD